MLGFSAGRVHSLTLSEVGLAVDKFGAGRASGKERYINGYPKAPLALSSCRYKIELLSFLLKFMYRHERHYL